MCIYTNETSMGSTHKRLLDGLSDPCMFAL